MPVTVLDSTVGTGDFPTDGLVLTPGAGDRRVGIVCCSHEMDGGGGMSMGTVTWGDQTVAELHDFVVGSITAYHNLNYMGYLTEAQLAAMSGNALSLTLTNGNGGVGPFGNAKAYMLTLQDCDQADIVSASNSATNTSTASLSPGSIDVDIDQKVVAFVVAGQPNPTAPGTGYTEDLAFTGPSNDHASGLMLRTATSNDDTHDIAHTCSAATRMAVSNICIGFDAGGTPVSNTMIAALEAMQGVSQTRQIPLEARSPFVSFPYHIIKEGRRDMRAMLTL